MEVGKGDGVDDGMAGHTLMTSLVNVAVMKAEPKTLNKMQITLSRIALPTTYRVEKIQGQGPSD